MDLCGEARNCDVALEVLDEAGVPPDAALEKRLKRRRASAAPGSGEAARPTGECIPHMRIWDGNG